MTSLPRIPFLLDDGRRETKKAAIDLAAEGCYHRDTKKDKAHPPGLASQTPLAGGVFILC
jgi:hypothetical protein